MRMTQDRKRAFIEQLRRDGVATRAALAASPGALGSCVQSFRDERHRDPRFAARWVAEDIMESLELFGTQVLPEFKERDEKLRADKAKRLEPVVEAAMKRRVDSAPEMPEGYTMDALPKQLIKAAGGDELLDQIESDTSTGKPRPQLENLLAREA